MQWFVLNDFSRRLSMKEFEVMTLEDMEELEDMVCLGDGGTISCCNGRDGNSSADVKVSAR